MCGILGTIRSSADLSPASFDRMLDTLTQRGPDGRGVEILAEGRVILGHRRLAIIDLSAAGRQPMANEDGSVWLSCNGEIYNYRELRSNLRELGHVFRSASDSEVLLHAWEEWGEDMLGRLEGIFAFALWDANREVLLLARDPIGVKPLYYAQYAGNFTFASQPKAIVADPAFARELDNDALRDFFAFGYVPHERAIFKRMHKLPAAHFAVVRDGKIEVKRYWQLRPQITTMPLAEAAWRLRDALSAAVDKQLVSDVPVGCFLSGGIDSSLLVALATASVSKLRSFTIGFDHRDSDERAWAGIVAQHFSTEHHEQVIEASDLSAKLIALGEFYDEPFDPNGPLPFMAVSELARRHNTVVNIGGDGADELFAGYRRYDDFDCPLAAASGAKRKLWRTLRLAGLLADRSLNDSDLQRYFAYEGCLNDDDQIPLLGASFRANLKDSASSTLARFFRRDLAPVDAARYADMNLYLVDHILTKVDRASMAYGVEARVPFLDPKVVELAFQFPTSINYANGERKAVLKLIAQQFLPASIVSARKKGFSTPLETWRNKRFDAWATSCVSDGMLMQSGVLNPDAVDSAGELRGLDSAQAARGRWLVLTAELWARRWLGEALPEAA